MAKSWSKYLDIFKNADKIAEGIKNTVFKKEHMKQLPLIDSNYVSNVLYLMLKEIAA